MILAAHQPDLLPHTGFWHKMAAVDVFDLGIYDQHQSRGYQRRVRMHDAWVGVSLRKPVPHDASIFTVRTVGGEAYNLWNQICEVYRDAPYFAERGPDIGRIIQRADCDRLWHFNVEVILGIRAVLGITTPLGLAPRPPKNGPTNDLVTLCRRYGADAYLSGTGAVEYLETTTRFGHTRLGDSDIRLYWSTHKPRTSDSVLTALFHDDDPMATIREVHQDAEYRTGRVAD